MPEKTWTSTELLEKFDNLSKNRKINVLYNAIDLMEMANHQSKSTVIFKSMGYTLDGETGNWIKEEDI